MTKSFLTFMTGGQQEIASAITCLICQNTIDSQLTLNNILSLGPIQPPLFCQACLDGLVPIDEKNVCLQCGRQIVLASEDAVNAEGFCGDCQSWHNYHDWHFTNQAFYQYNTVFKDWLVVLKGQGDIRGRHLFAKTLKGAYRKHKEAIWVPMPSSSGKVANRGFNQTSLLLEAAGIPYKDVLTSEGSQGKQAYKSRQDRLKDRDKIQLKMPLTELDKQQTIIIFDDVYTTGTTMFSAYKAFVLAGYTQIQGITLAR